MKCYQKIDHICENYRGWNPTWGDYNQTENVCFMLYQWSFAKFSYAKMCEVTNSQNNQPIEKQQPSFETQSMLRQISIEELKKILSELQVFGLIEPLFSDYFKVNEKVSK